jgi:AcrR family transcriptional regulator
MSEIQKVRVGRPPSVIDGQRIPDRLLDQARKLFAEKGFDRTSVQDIVAAAGVTKGAMYHYFRSKDDLLYEIYARVLRMQTEHLTACAEGEGTPVERVHAACADVVVTTLENRESTTVFFFSLPQLTPQKQVEIRAERRHYHEMFRGMIEEGQRTGVFRTDVSADIATDFFFGSIHHLPTWWNPSGSLSPQELGEQFASLFLASIRQDAGEAAAPTARRARSA